MNLSRRQLSRLFGIFALASVGLVGALTLGGSVSAHYPVLESQTSRDCGDTAPWTATVTARSDQDWDKDWKGRHQVDGGALSAWSPLTDDQVPYTFGVGPFDASVTSVNVGVESRWFLKSDGSLSVKASRSITITRPDSQNCGDTVTPAAPAVTYDCVTDQLVINGADDTKSVDYTVKITQAPDGEGSTWAVKITAAPQPGYEFAPDATTTWTFTGTVDCKNGTVTPAAPAVTYDCVTDQLVINGADDTKSVDYTVKITQAPDGEGSTWAVKITAAPQPGYEFAPDATTTWTFTGTVDCLTTTNPAAPAVTYDCVTDQLVINGADDTKSVDYTVKITQAPDGEGSTWAVKITAAPQPGYEFAPDATTTWTFTGTVDCLTTTNPAAPAVTYDCVTDQLVINGADDTKSVDYTVKITQAPDGEGSTWAVKITAAPQPGYEFAPDATTTWTFTGTVDCLTTTNPAAPAVTYDCVTDQLVINGADDTKSVDYTVKITQAPDGEGSTWAVKITAAPQPGYEFAPDATTTWTFTGTVDCLTTTTPAAPELTCRLAPDKGLALQLTPSTTYSYEVSGNLDVNENDPYDVTVVAVPAAGYEFPSDATTQWRFTGVVECQRSLATTTTTIAPTTTTIAPTTTTTTPTGSTTTTTTPKATAVTGSSSTGLLLAYASVMTLLGALLLLIKRTFRPEPV